MKKEKNKWDIFISYASEDKDEIAKPLAEGLKDAGAKVWYDEFELKLGDSLSRSIDRGLIDSKYGIVILSNNFFKKKWTEYELRSLVAKDMSGNSVILPIWHKADVKQIQEYSLFLSDIKGLTTELPIDELINEILRIVRPDILDNHFMLALGRKLAKQKGTIKLVPKESISENPHPHTVLPVYMVISCRLISEVFKDVIDMGYEEMLNEFAKDYDYLREFKVFSAMANAYVEFIRETHCPFDHIEKKKEAFDILYRVCSGYPFDSESTEYKYLSEQEQRYLVEGYINNHKHISSMLEKLT